MNRKAENNPSNVTHSLIVICSVTTSLTIGLLATKNNFAVAEEAQATIEVSEVTDSKVHPVNPMNPAEDANPVDPQPDSSNEKASTAKPEQEQQAKAVTQNHKIKTKHKIKQDAHPPIAFLSDRTPSAMLNPPLALAKTASGDFALHLSGTLLFGTKNSKSSILPQAYDI